MLTHQDFHDEEAIDKIFAALDAVRDQDAPMDTGGGMKSRDCWITVDGVEFLISIALSGNEKARRKDTLRGG